MNEYYLTDEDIHGFEEDSEVVELRNKLERANERIEELEDLIKESKKEKIIDELNYYVYLSQEECKEESKELEFDEIKNLVDYIDKLEKQNRHLLDLQKNMDKEYQELERKTDEVLTIVNTEVKLKNDTFTSLKRFYDKRNEEIVKIILGNSNE